ncbi:MAG: hypothetical protein ABSC25_13330 [Roseiarcus sp.]
MRSISLQFAARAIAAALFMAILAMGAGAAPGLNYSPPVRAPAPPPPPAPTTPNIPAPAIMNQQSQATGACGVGLELAPAPEAGDVGDAVNDLSAATQKYIKDCQCASQQCVADALDKYAEALAAVAPRLPPRLRNLPSVVAQAARRVRAARTKAQAVQAINAAIAVIHKDMTLVRAEDAETRQRETRSGALVADTLNVASLSLEKGGGL